MPYVLVTHAVFADLQFEWTGQSDMRRRQSRFGPARQPTWPGLMTVSACLAD